jgi:4-amino-4-deoxy-L-arabinose transferase-like glycosyltransferase
VNDSRQTQWLPYLSLALIVLIALALRLLFVLVIDASPDFGGGDANWYMENGHDLVKFGKTLGPLQTPPLYLIFLGAVQELVPGTPYPGYAYTTDEMQAVRVIQAFLGAGLVLFVYRLVRRLFSERIATLAAFILAISPALVIEAGNLTTEGLFLFWVFGGLAAYVDPNPLPIIGEGEALGTRVNFWMVAAGILFGLATLTRAIFLLFPLIIAAHVVLTQRGRWLRPVLALLVSYGLVASTWTVYNLAVWNRLVIGGEGLFSFLYQGAEGKADPDELDQQVGVTQDDSHQDRETALREEAAESITSDPVGWAAHRVKDLGKAYLQPHNTVHFGGKSIKDAVWGWLKNDRSAGGLRDVTHIEAFWPKLAIYAFHFGGLLLGAAGMGLLWRRWRDLLPLYGMIAYFTGIHLILLALPRYLFPVYPVAWVFASALLVRLKFLNFG